ncbi:OprD family outer membrane porin [Pseudomonas sp. fls2-241-R2A-110]|uniref:OprD family outer membrane porin n=1 Tax=Pseudomonas sp. fls2-241-R2A-110 TaxID=3040311 RepID=UPI0025535E05|nr:OprD family outer membrane porin [Pseudomonas sp. fls2-241-R2A-110]
MCEWEQFARLDYVVHTGPMKDLSFSFRRANYRTGLPETTAKDQDQTSLYQLYLRSLVTT